MDMLDLSLLVIILGLYTVFLSENIYVRLKSITFNIFNINIFLILICYKFYFYSLPDMACVLNSLESLIKLLFVNMYNL